MIEYGSKITAEEYMELRRQVGWREFPLDQAETGLKNSYFVLCARDGGKAIGMVRLLWDGGYTAYLADVAVDPEYQGMGIGKIFVETCIEKLKGDLKPGYRVKVNLIAAKGKEPFYEKFGFESRPNENGGCGMDMWIYAK